MDPRSWAILTTWIHRFNQLLHPPFCIFTVLAFDSLRGPIFTQRRTCTGRKPLEFKYFTNQVLLYSFHFYFIKDIIYIKYWEWSHCTNEKLPMQVLLLTIITYRISLPCSHQKIYVQIFRIPVDLRESNGSEELRTRI